MRNLNLPSCFQRSITRQSSEMLQKDNEMPNGKPSGAIHPRPIFMPWWAGCPRWNPARVPWAYSREESK